MTVKELVDVMDKHQGIVIIPNIGDAGFYRYNAGDVPPMFLSADVRRVVPHNRAEISVEVVVR
jgi:hypothetical protein